MTFPKVSRVGLAAHSVCSCSDRAGIWPRMLIAVSQSFKLNSSFIMRISEWVLKLKMSHSKPIQLTTKRVLRVFPLVYTVAFNFYVVLLLLRKFCLVVSFLEFTLVALPLILVLRYMYVFYIFRVVCLFLSSEWIIECNSCDKKIPTHVAAYYLSFSMFIFILSAFQVCLWPFHFIFNTFMGGGGHEISNKRHDDDNISRFLCCCLVCFFWGGNNWLDS